MKLRQFKCRCSYRPEANKCGAVHNNLNGCANVQHTDFHIKSIYIHFLQLVKRYDQNKNKKNKK